MGGPIINTWTVEVIRLKRPMLSDPSDESFHQWGHSTMEGQLWLQSSYRQFIVEGQLGLVDWIGQKCIQGK